MSGEAHELQQKGIEHFEQHDYEAAARYFQQAKDLYEAEETHDMAAEMAVNIGLVHRALAENQQALELMQEALRIFQDQEDELRMAQVLGNMGGVYMALNDKEQAFLSYRQAADLFRDLGEQQMYSQTMLALGNLQVRDGKLFAGAVSYQLGLEDMQNLTTRQKILKRLTQFMAALGNTPR